MTGFQRALDLIFTAFAVVAGGMLAVQAVVVATDAILRSVATPFSWGVEVNTYLLMAEGTLAAPWALRRGAHFRVTLLTDKLPRRAQQIIAVVGNAVAAGLFAVLSWQAWDLTADTLARDIRSGTSLDAPLFLPQGAIALGMALLSLAFVSEAVDAWFGRSSHAAPDELTVAGE